MSRRSFDERCRLLAASFTETGSPRTSIHEMLRDRIEMGRPATVLARGAWPPTLPMATSETPEIAGNGGYGLAGCVWPKPSRPAEKAKGQHPMKKRAPISLGCLAVRSSQGPEIGVERGSNRPDHKAGAAGNDHPALLDRDYAVRDKRLQPVVPVEQKTALVS